MTSRGGKVAELRVKNLEMIQAIVSRIASNGAATKNYCVTVITAVRGFAVTLQRPLLALLAFLPLTGFALLDAQYLRVERQFRALFDNVRRDNWNRRPDFDLGTQKMPPILFRKSFFSWSILSFYAPIAAGVAFIAVIARFAYGI